jgi:hypothetical protein
MSSFDTPDPFDPLDDELRRRFGASAPADADPDLVLDAMRPQLRRARVRRRASIATALGGIAAVVVVLAFVLGGGGDGGTGSVRVPPATNGPVTSVPTSPSTTTPTGGSATPGTVPDTVDDRGTDVATTVPGSSATTPASAPPDTAPVTQAPPSQSSYSSAGGSITVNLANGAVSLASSSPAPGYSAELHDNGPTRVEVRFDNGETEWRIRVDVQNGQLVSEVTQH